MPKLWYNKGEEKTNNYVLSYHRKRKLYLSKEYREARDLELWWASKKHVHTTTSKLAECYPSQSHNISANKWKKEERIVPAIKEEEEEEG